MFYRAARMPPDTLLWCVHGWWLWLVPKRNQLWRGVDSVLGEKRLRSPTTSPVRRRTKSATKEGKAACTPQNDSLCSPSSASPRRLQVTVSHHIPSDSMAPSRMPCGPGSPDPRKRMLRGGLDAGMMRTAPVSIPRKSSLSREGRVISPACNIQPLAAPGSFDRNGNRPRLVTPRALAVVILLVTSVYLRSLW